METGCPWDAPYVLMQLDDNFDIKHSNGTPSC